jgi:hypothetical protein
MDAAHYHCHIVLAQLVPNTYTARKHRPTIKLPMFCVTTNAAIDSTPVANINVANSKAIQYAIIFLRPYYTILY